MADTNSYTSKEHVRKYTTQSKFDAIDRTDIPVGTEYNIVGAIEKSDLSSSLQSTINSVDGKLDKTGGTITGSLVISQDLVVNGTTSTVEATTLKVADKLIYVAKDNEVSLTTPAGLITPKYDGTNSGGIVYDNTGTAYVGDVTLDSNGNIDIANSELQPLATRDVDDGLTDGNLLQWDGTNKKLIDSGKKTNDFPAATEVVLKSAASNGQVYAKTYLGANSGLVYTSSSASGSIAYRASDTANFKVGTITDDYSDTTKLYTANLEYVENRTAVYVDSDLIGG